MKNGKNRRRAAALSGVIKQHEKELNIAAGILEWEIGDLWGHVGVRLPDDRGIAVRMFRRPERGKKKWLVHFDYSLTKLSGVWHYSARVVIYTEIFKARPDVNAVVHCHPAMCIALSLADKPVDWVHMQSSRFNGGTPIFPRPIYILDPDEGAAVAATLGQGVSGHDQGPRHRHCRRDDRRSDDQPRSIWNARRRSWPSPACMAIRGRRRSRSTRRARAEKNCSAGLGMKCFIRPTGTTTRTRLNAASAGREVGRDQLRQSLSGSDLKTRFDSFVNHFALRGASMFSKWLGIILLVLLAPMQLNAQETYLVAYAGFAAFKHRSGRQGSRLFTKYGFQRRCSARPRIGAPNTSRARGSIHLAQIDAATGINAINQGADLIMISGTLNNFPYSFVTQKEIRKPRTLSAKKSAYSPSEERLKQRRFSLSKHGTYRASP